MFTAVFLGGPGQTMPGRVKAGRTIEDCSPILGPPVLAEVGIIPLRTNHYGIIKHHSCRPRPSPAVLTHPRPSSPVHVHLPPSIPLPGTNMSHPVGPAVLLLGRPGRTTASRPVPSGALGTPPGGPRRAPRRLRTLLVRLFAAGVIRHG